MSRPEFWLRRLTVAFLCAVLILICIYVMIRIFDLIAPIP